MRQLRELLGLVVQLFQPELERFAVQAGAGAERVDLHQDHRAFAADSARHLVDQPLECRPPALDRGQLRAVLAVRVDEEGAQHRNRRRRRIGAHVGAEDLRRLRRDRARAAPLGIQADVLSLPLIGDLAQLLSLRVCRDRRGMGDLEARPAVGVGEAGGIEPQQLRNRAGGLPVLRSVNEEVRPLQRITVRRRDRKRERVGRISGAATSGSAHAPADWAGTARPANAAGTANRSANADTQITTSAVPGRPRVINLTVAPTGG